MTPCINHLESVQQDVDSLEKLILSIGLTKMPKISRQLNIFKFPKKVRHILLNSLLLIFCPENIYLLNLQMLFITLDEI